MKRCPTCNRTFDDQSLSFCIEDGTPLVKVVKPATDAEATIVGPSSAKTQIDTGATSPASQNSTTSDWNAPPYQPPGRSAPQPAIKGRRVWPWVVGIVALLLVGVAGIGIAVALVIPNMMRAANENNANTNSNSERNLNNNASANTNTNANTNSYVANENANANTNSGPATEPPTDEEEVLAELTDLEKEWTEANFSADKKTLARILADDYVGTQPNGTIQGKADYLKDIKPETGIRDWELKDLKLTLKGDRATLQGRMRVAWEGKDQELVVLFIDKFVWRDGRWQAVASEVSQTKQ